MTPMAAMRFRFEQTFDEPSWRERLRAEVGGRRAGPRCIDAEWSPDAGGGGELMLLSQNVIALVYGAKVCLALGGRHLPLTPGGKDWAPPEWSATPWVALPWTTRFRLWLGPTRI
jgi:hypothetical protein